MSKTEVTYIDHLGSDLTVVNAARVSFHKSKDQFDKSDEKLLKYLADHNHWSPFAHPQISVRVKAPIFVARQLVKHQIGLTWNEVSRRYVDDDPEFLYPETWRLRPDASIKQGSSDEVLTDEETVEDIESAYASLLWAAESLYENLLKKGVAPEQARIVLPLATFTEWVWTGSLQAFARVYNLRSDPHAQKETQEFATLLGDIVRSLYPVSWSVLTND